MRTMATRRSAWLGVILGSWALLALAGAAWADDPPPPGPGDLDRSFGGTGFVAVPAASNSSGMIQAMAVDSGGRLIAVGREADRWVVLRFTAGDPTANPPVQGGALDTTFGTGGKVYPLDLLPGAEAVDVALDAQDRAVVVGTYGAPYPSGLRLTVVRLTAVGTRDSTFGDDGIVQLKIDNATTATAVKIQGQRIVVAGGCANKKGYWSMLVARLLDDGSLDRISFGTPTDPKLVKKGHPPFLGYIVDDFNSGQSECIFDRALALQPSDEIVVGGFHASTARQHWPWSGRIAWTLVRYAPDGRSRDAAFGLNGVVTERPNVPDWEQWWLKGVTVQPLGTALRILVCGVGYDEGGSGAQGIVVGYTENGSLDTGFGDGGLAAGLARTAMQGWSQAWQVAVDGAGKIVVGVSASGSKFAFRFTSDGTPDSTFGPDPQWPGLSAPAALTGDNTEWCASMTLDHTNGVLVGGASQLREEPFTMYLSVAKFLP